MIHFITFASIILGLTIIALLVSAFIGATMHDKTHLVQRVRELLREEEID